MAGMAQEGTDLAQRKLVTLFDRLDGDRKLKKATSKLLNQLRERNEQSTETFVDRAHDSIRPIVAAFFDVFPGPIADDELHKFRIAGKDLRYAMELLAGAFPPEFRKELYPTMSELQDKLGRINDLTVAAERLRKRMDDSSDPADISDLRRRCAVLGDELNKDRDDFHSWWTQELRSSLRARFDEFLKSPPSLASDPTRHH